MMPRFTTRPAGPWLLAPAVALVLAGPAAAQPPACQPLRGAEAEQFLRTATVIARKPIGCGITRSEKLTLSDGRCTARAAFKTIHTRLMGLTKMANGRVEFDFRDSWKHDVAAYELDKLLGLDLVPPTVERRIDGRVGSLQLWIEGAMTELARRDQGVTPPDLQAWAERRADITLLRELAFDTDYNIQNTLYDPEFRVYAIDFSRAFRIDQNLLSPERLDRFPQRVLDRLRALDEAKCEAHLRPWLERFQIAGLLHRRDQLVALGEQRLAAATSSER